MMVIRSLLLTCFFFLVGCSSPADENGGTPDSNNNGNSNLSFKLSEFNKNYTFLQSDSKVKDRNFYWTTLIEKNTSVRSLIENDKSLSAFLLTAKNRLSIIANQSNVTAAQYADALRFSDNERTTISLAIKNAIANNGITFINFSNEQIGPSGAFNHFQDITDVSRLNQLIVEELLLGINQIIDTYVAGINPKYPDLDRVSYDVNSDQYKLLLKNLVSDLNSTKDQFTLFYQPFLNFALKALELNKRGEAGYFESLKDGENALAYQSIQSINWNNYSYSMLVVLGDAPNSSGDLPNISKGGMERCDYAVTLFNKGLAPLIVFTGGNVAPFQSEYFEAIEMKKYVMSKYGIPSNKILVDPHARHTTTNMRNVGRLAFCYGIPIDKKALLSTTKDQCDYVASKDFATRSMTEMEHIPISIGNRISDRDLEFTPLIKVLHLDSSDPLDP